MQVDPPWRVRKRPCPFYAKGNCIFSRNCNFLHATEDDSDSSLSENSKLGLDFQEIPDTSEENSAFLVNFLDNYDEDSHYDNDQGFSSDDDSSQGSPTVRNPAKRTTITTANLGQYRDSIATIKAEDYNESEGYMSSPPPQTKPARDSQTRSIPKLSLTIPSNKTVIPRPPPENHENLHNTDTQGQTPSSGFTTAQVVEVPTVHGRIHPVLPQFTLSTISDRSSLLANRLAKSRARASSSAASSALEIADAASPYSAGDLIASYQRDDTTLAVDAAKEGEFLGTAPQAVEDSLKSPLQPSSGGPKTPTWLKPLRLTTLLTGQSETQETPPPSATVRSKFQGPVSDRGSSIYYSTSSGSSKASGSSRSTNAKGHFEKSAVTRSSVSQSHIRHDTAHTIVVSDPEGYSSPMSISRASTVEIDISRLPPLPSDSEASFDANSSPSSIALSELLGRSPKPVPQSSLPLPDEVPVNRSRSPSPVPTGSATHLRRTLQRRADKIRESSMLLTELQSYIAENASPFALESDAVKTLEKAMSNSRSSSFSQSAHSVSLHDSFPDSLAVNNQPEPHQAKTATLESIDMKDPPSPPRVSSQQNTARPPSISPTGPLLTPVAQSTPPVTLSPRPNLLFAIASDEPAEVERLLASGEASINESTGTGQGLLEFTVANENLKNKTEIVKTLLKYGADPEQLKKRELQVQGGEDTATLSPGLAKRLDEGMNPAVKYYLNRPESLDLESKATLKALEASSFAPLVKAKFDIIGQDRVLEEFFRVLGRHSQRKGRNALVILLCGSSGHGKSFLAQKVGTLLNVPTHTINMTALRSQHDLWQCLSTGIEDASPHLDLGEFLVENQGKRCVVVLDEIEKVDDPKALNPLLLPWDIGRCSLEQKRHTDTSQVIWIATSNLGRKIIAEHVEKWDHPDVPPSRAEYMQLATAIRRSISEILGASLLSRITVILPFLPFTETEKVAIGTEAALSFQQFIGTPMTAAELEILVKAAVKDVNFVEEEGARSLYRVVEAHMTKAL